MSLDLSHYAAISGRLSRERDRLDEARRKGDAKQIEFRSMLVDQAEKEIEAERRFLGIPNPAPFQGTDEELLAELGL